jgi:DNA-binding NtrC family response regulator
MAHNSTEGKSVLSVLIVDDETNMRRTLADILSLEGYRVTTASDGEQAVAICNAQPQDVVLMDVRMPGIDGFEALRRIRQTHADARIILMSAFTISELRQQALEEGAIAILPKPLDVEKVVRLIGDIKSTSILVVEYDAPVAEALGTLLRDRGYRVMVTDSPQSALDLVERIRFDVIFIGTRLPSISGLDLYLAIRRITPGVAAIMIADGSSDSDSMAVEAVRQTAYAFVRKPLNPAEILRLIERHVGQTLSGQAGKPDL